MRSKKIAKKVDALHREIISFYALLEQERWERNTSETEEFWQSEIDRCNSELEELKYKKL